MSPLDLRGLRKELTRLADELGEKTKTARKVAASVLDTNDPHHVVGYRGFGNAVRALVHARALQDEGITRAEVKDPAWRNLMNSFKRMETDPLAHARVRVRFGGAERELEADQEGFVREWIEVPGTLPGDASWHAATLELLSPLRDPAEKVSVSVPILVPPSSAAFGVISDIDDTVLQSQVSNFIQAVRTVALGNARTRLPFPGVAAFYQALHQGAGTAGEAPAGRGSSNPIFYVSSSPWNLYDLISDFLEHQQIPAGPVLLRDWDVTLGALAGQRHHEHKLARIREIMDTYPSLPFILIGDTTQQDPEIYRHVVGEYPGRILAVYIRNVHAQPQRSAAVRKLADEILAAHSTLILADDTLAAAKHAAEKGWIAPGALPSIGEEKRADEGKTDEKVGPPAGGESKTAPTVVVSDDPAAQVAKGSQ